MLAVAHSQLTSSLVVVALRSFSLAFASSDWILLAAMRYRLALKLEVKAKDRSDILSISCRVFVSTVELGFFDALSLLLGFLS